ncbi:hypothetical protein V8B97DRAFT_2079028 [Scleroderma yunnanense]
MILETLGRIRSKSVKDGSNASGIFTDTGIESDYTPERTSHISTNTASTSSVYPASSPTSSPSPRSAKRYSNNLFASGRLRDYSYLRSASQKSGSHRSAVSITQSDSSQSLREETSLNFSDSGRPATPEGSGPDSSAPSSLSEKTPVARSASLISSVEDMPSQFEPASYSGNTQLPEGSSSASRQRAASAALAQVIKEIEEEAEVEDEIVMPRTTRTPRPAADRERVFTDESGLLNNSSSHLHLASEYEAGTAISSDKHIVVEPGTQRMSPIPAGRPGAASPTPRLPGYVPGMPRPMTPRDPILDDDIRSHSTTPRATSPLLPNLNGHVSQLSTTSLTSGLLRRGSDASRSTPRPTSPPSYTPSSPYLSRNISGRRTPDESQRDSTSGTEQDSSASSIFLRRRPVSPLSSTTFQPMSVSPRPSTPSNVTWNVAPATSPEKAHSKSESRSMHSRNGSLVSEAEFSSYSDRSKSSNMSPRSTASPDGPTSSAEYRSPSSLSGHDNGLSLSSSRTFRSPTPTQSRTVASPTFASSDSITATLCSSKPHTSNFSLGTPQFTPLANSSRSSLESTGSSYHSDPGQTKRYTLDIFNSSAHQTPSAWHDLDKSSSATLDSSREDGDFEDIIRRYAGLSKSDIFAIQEQLVVAVVQKSNYPDTRERANSLRRRRPSTSQSNYSVSGRESRVASPQPTQAATSGSRSPAPDINAKASALLESVVGSIPPTNLAIDSKVESDSPPEVSPTTRRNRDLARALGFGTEEEDNTLLASQPSHEPDPSSSSASLTVEAILPPVTYPDVEEVNVPANSTLQPEVAPLTSSTSTSLHRSASVRDPLPVDQSELAKEVQRRVDAATALMHSGQKFTDANASSVSVTRKKISPSQISTPVLVSAPPSVETIPLPSSVVPSPSNPTPSLGLTQRMRRLRNTLRVKPTVSSVDETTTFTTDQQLQPQPQSQTNSSGLSRRPTLPLPRFGTNGSADLVKLKQPSTNTPASTTPGLKGLMARFRKPRAPENNGDSHSSGHSRTSPTTSSPTTSSHRGNSAATGSTNSGVSTSVEGTTRPSPVTAALTSEVDSAAVKQLFEAASNLGLDQAALNDLLARSTSISRAAGWGLSAGASAAAGNKSLMPPMSNNGNNVDRNRPTTPDERKNDVSSTVNGVDSTIMRRPSMRKPTSPTPTPTMQPSQTPENSAVVRRTFIFPSEFRASKVDLSQPSRKQPSKRHRRTGSTTSAQSTRSVHDRAPTPPPPKSNGARRLSTDRSPPVPSMATSITAQAEALLRGPTRHAAQEKSNSAYESLYDMYAGEGKQAGTVLPDPGKEHGQDGTTTQEGTALEVIEMANGETIWTIVNGLREDDVESYYTSRPSSPDNSPENKDEMQIFVKEHARSTSKSSSSSFLSLKKAYQSKDRPETKIYYSSSAQIGRLIESLSQGMDSGSFNFVPTQLSDRSSPSSFHSNGDNHWTVEERLEQMLGAMRDS